jgi:hypothetical protein
MKYLLIFISAVVLFATDQSKPDSPEKQIEALKSENAKLKEQLEQFRKAVALEMRIREGSLQACREAALEAQKPTKDSK